MSSSSDFHEDNSSTKSCGSTSLPAPTIGISMEKPTEVKEFIFAAASLTSPKQTCVITGKQEARSVCDKISQLLRDKQSGTRGSYMFRKRRKRSEKFAIIGYGTQPASGQESPSELIEEDLDSGLMTSSDDEIDAYDYTGFNNFLKHDKNLSSSEKIIRHQYTNLANDTKHMKGKGAKMFAKRQERMEKYIVEGISSAQANTQNNEVYKEEFESASSQQFFCEESKSQSQSQRMYTSEADQAKLQFFPSDFHNIKHDEKKYSVLDEQIKGSTAQMNINEKPSCPKQRMPWISTSSSSEVSKSAEAIFNFRKSNASDNHSQRLEENFSKTGFRKVTPPNPSNLLATLPVTNEETSSASSLRSSSTFTVMLQKPTKAWSPVKFEPKQKSIDSNQAADEQIHVAYPSAASINDAKDETSLTFVNNKQTIPFKSVCELPMVCRSKKLSQETSKASDCSTSVQSVSSRTYTPKHANTQIMTNCQSQKSKAADAFVNQDISGDAGLLTFSNPEQATHITYTSVSKPQTSCLPPKHFNRPSDDPNPSKNGTSSEEDLQKPKVAACLKLLDPTKGKYEPKMSIVYQQTPSFSAQFHQNEKRSSDNDNSTPMHFNKATSKNENISHATYVKEFPKASCQSNKQHQPLGSLAGELKGKGARMFEKQQKRMDHFTRESNGTALHGTAQPSPCNQVRGPENKAKETMSKVVGEFKKVSVDGDLSKPSSTRTTKNKDPYHYHSFYVPGQAPSAEDFVCANDYNDVASDSNRSTTSSMTSFDRHSRTSSNMFSVNENEEIENMKGNGDSKSAKNPPGVAPKPKLNLSGEQLSPPSCGNGEPLFTYLPSPPSYANSTLPSFSKPPESQTNSKLRSFSLLHEDKSVNIDKISSLHLQSQTNEASKVIACPKSAFNATASVAKWKPNNKDEI